MNRPTIRCLRTSKLAGVTLDEFSRVPGLADDGSLNSDELRAWTEDVRKLAQAKDRLGVADITLGRLFARMPRPKDNDELWPPSPMAEVMESISSDDLFRGFENGVFYGRGVVTKSSTEGGDLEMRLAASYRRLAEKHQSRCPQLAASFRGLADNYEEHARVEDEDAERRRLNR